MQLKCRILYSASWTPDNFVPYPGFEAMLKLNGRSITTHFVPVLNVTTLPLPWSIISNIMFRSMTKPFTASIRHQLKWYEPCKEYIALCILAGQYFDGFLLATIGTSATYALTCVHDVEQRMKNSSICYCANMKIWKTSKKLSISQFRILVIRRKSHCNSRGFSLMSFGWWWAQ